MWKRLGLSLGTLAIASAVLFPVYWMIVTALLPTSAILVRDPALVPAWASLTGAAFRFVLVGHPFLRWFANSALVAAGTVVLSLTVAVPAAYSLSRTRSAVQSGLGLGLLVSKMLPGSLVAIPFFVMASRAGLVDSRWALILANTSVGVPFATWMMRGFFDGIPREIEAAARIDGCTRWGAFRLVVLPLARPGLAACAAYLFIVAWADFVFVRTLVNTPDRWTISAGLMSFFGEYNVNWPALMAAGVVSLLPVWLLFVVLEPLLVGGMTAGWDK